MLKEIQSKRSEICPGGYKNIYTYNATQVYARLYCGFDTKSHTDIKALCQALNHFSKCNDTELATIKRYHNIEGGGIIGHIINEKFGASGKNYENLMLITKKANSQHANQIEYSVGCFLKTHQCSEKDSFNIGESKVEDYVEYYVYLFGSYPCSPNHDKSLRCPEYFNAVAKFYMFNSTINKYFLIYRIQTEDIINDLSLFSSEIHDL